MKRLAEKTRKRIKRKQRIRKKISGTQERPRVSVHKSNKHIYLQVINDEEGHTLAATSTRQPALKGLKNTKEDASKVGKAMGERLKEIGIQRIVFDRSGYIYHGVVKAVADGMREAGIEF